MSGRLEGHSKGKRARYVQAQVLDWSALDKNSLSKPRLHAGSKWDDSRNQMHLYTLEK